VSGAAARPSSSDAIGLDGAWGNAAVRVAMGPILLVAGVQTYVGGLARVSWAGSCSLIGFRTRWLGLLFADESVVAAFWVKLRLTGFESASSSSRFWRSALLRRLNGVGGPPSTAADGG
jgi:hypothetical protein